MAAIQPLAPDGLAPSPETMTDEELLECIRILKRSGTTERMLTVRREGVRRGIVIKLVADLLPPERLELEASWRVVGETRNLVNELEPPTRYLRQLTDRGIEAAKERLAEALETAKEAERRVRDLEKRYGLQSTIKYLLTDG